MSFGRLSFTKLIHVVFHIRGQSCSQHSFLIKLMPMWSVVMVPFLFLLLVICICSLTRGASLVAQTVKNLPAMQETWLDPWVGKIFWRREWPPTPVFLPGQNSMDWGASLSTLLIFSNNQLWVSLYFSITLLFLISLISAPIFLFFWFFF